MAAQTDSSNAEEVKIESKRFCFMKNSPFQVELREVIAEDDLDMEEEDIFDGEDELNQAD